MMATSVYSLSEPRDLSRADELLFKGIYLGDLAMVRGALKQGADPAIENFYIGKKAIHMAAQYGNVRIIDELLTYDEVYIDSEDRLGKHALDLAREFGHIAAEEALISHVKMHPERYELFLSEGMPSRFYPKFLAR
jgi:ankyrin repeat protein